MRVPHVSERRREKHFHLRFFFAVFFPPASAFLPFPPMSRGNQRDIDRARAAARAGKAGVKSKDKDGLTASQRKER